MIENGNSLFNFYRIVILRTIFCGCPENGIIPNKMDSFFLVYVHACRLCRKTASIFPSAISPFIYTF